MGEIIIAIIGALGIAASGLFLFLGTRGRTRTDAKSALDARIDARVEHQLAAAWTEIDGLKTQVENQEQREKVRTGAFGRILRAIAAQWPDTHGPNLDPADIAEIEDTIPSAWIRGK